MEKVRKLKLWLSIAGYQELFFVRNKLTTGEKQKKLLLSASLEAAHHSKPEIQVEFYLLELLLYTSKKNVGSDLLSAINY